MAKDKLVFTKQPITCVGLGEILYDILPAGPRLGGAPANFTFHAKQMGLDSMAVSCVGKDEWGDKALEQLGEHQVKTLVFRSDKVTGYVKADIDEHGVPTYDFAKDTAYDHIPLNDELLKTAANTMVCCFGTLAQRQSDGESHKSILAFLDAMPEQSLKPVVCKLLGYDDLTPAQFYEQVLQGKYQIEQFIYTGGENGSDTFYYGEHSYLPTPKVQVVDTVGAGDSFTATFVGLTVQGVDFREAHKTAVDVAAYVCTQEGAMPVLSAELLERIQKLKANTAA